MSKGLIVIILGMNQTTVPFSMVIFLQVHLIRRPLLGVRYPLQAVPAVIVQFPLLQVAVVYVISMYIVVNYWIYIAKNIRGRLPIVEL